MVSSIIYVFLFTWNVVSNSFEYIFLKDFIFFEFDHLDCLWGLRLKEYFRIEASMPFFEHWSQLQALSPILCNWSSFHCGPQAATSPRCVGLVWTPLVHLRDGYVKESALSFQGSKQTFPNMISISDLYFPNFHMPTCAYCVHWEIWGLNLAQWVSLSFSIVEEESNVKILRSF